ITADYGKTWGGADNSINGDVTAQDAINAYYGLGTPRPVGQIYDVDFYWAYPLNPFTRPRAKDPCRTKMLGDEKGPHYTLRIDEHGDIVDSMDSLWQLIQAAERRVVE